MVGYRFCIAYRKKIYLEYVSEEDSSDELYRIHNEEVMMSKVTHAKYGFTDFKLKGGVVLEEIKAIKILKEHF